MKIEHTIVPKGKCPLDVLAELGEQTRNSWIYLHDDVVKHLARTANHNIAMDSSIKLTFDETEKSSKRTIIVDYFGSIIWHEVHFIIADNIPFKVSVTDPDNIFFLKMKE